MSTNTIYLAMLVVVLWGGWLILVGLRHSPLRLPLLTALVALCGFGAWQAPWLARTLSGDPAQKSITALHSIYDDPDSTAGEFLRLLSEVDPNAMAYFEQAAREAAEQPDPQAYLNQRAAEYGMSLAPQLGARLAAGSDETFQQLVALMAPVADRLPEQDADCAALLQGSTLAATERLLEGMAEINQRLIAVLVELLRETRGKAPAALTAADLTFMQDHVSIWVSRLNAADVNFLMAMGVAPPDFAAGEGGPLCRVLKTLFQHMGTLPEPEGGRLLRLIIAAGAMGG